VKDSMFSAPNRCRILPRLILAGGTLMAEGNVSIAKRQNTEHLF